VIGDIVPPRDCGRYSGPIGGVFGVSTVLGPLLGGSFVDNLSWRWISCVNLPIGIIGFVVLAVVLNVPVTRARHVIDYLGVGQLAAGETRGSRSAAPPGPGESDRPALSALLATHDVRRPLGVTDLRVRAVVKARQVAMDVVGHDLHRIRSPNRLSQRWTLPPTWLRMNPIQQLRTPEIQTLPPIQLSSCV
jgi:MFS family permease